MTTLPIQANLTAPAGGQWAQTFQFPDTDITGLTWEFVIRPTAVDTTQPALIEVTTTITAQGWITVDTAARTVQVVLTDAATRPLGKASRAYALWSNPGTGQDIPWAAGRFNTQPVAAP
ncbi:hypothetical protein ACWC09_26265 [Streptomyces sp. NPDC001617]